MLTRETIEKYFKRINDIKVGFLYSSQNVESLLSGNVQIFIFSLFFYFYYAFFFSNLLSIIQPEKKIHLISGIRLKILIVKMVLKECVFQKNKKIRMKIKKVMKIIST